MIRNAGRIRWAGTGLMVAGAALSASRIANATDEQRPIVASEEVGGMGGGFLGSEIAVGTCLFFGVATEGFGLLACGALGGLGGGVIGHAAGHEAGESIVAPAVNSISEYMGNLSQSIYQLYGVPFY